MAKISTVTFHGKSGKKYVFDVWHLNQSFREVGGVYGVTRRYLNAEGNYSHDVIYVGQTNNLSIRFGSHHKSDCFSKHNANCVCTLMDGDEESRLNLEDDLVQSYNPACNN
jgi:hypothetical protein